MAALHVFSVIGAAIAVVLADEQGIEWFLGKKRTLEERSVRWSHIFVSIGLAAALLTGGLMFIDRAEYLIHNPAFLLKMDFVLALVVNGFFIERISSLATKYSFSELTREEKTKALVSGAVSMAGWVGAALLGLLLVYG
ncbi:MAG: hypothetical protein ABA06_02735 [Parcubacteria bacterium C7867-001]|nr:MAG: hypothetical protein ABA06_02735 [Parcubacteria bacterium C7867-001]